VYKAARDRAEVERKLEKLDTDHRSQVLAELQQAEVNLAEIRSRLEATSTKFAYVGMVKSQLVSGSDSKPELTIVRSGEQGNEYIKASEETELRPGDVVEVALSAGVIPKPGAHAEK
jgi:polysaccharide export outer membrane protein